MPAQLFLRIWIMIIINLAFQDYLSGSCAGLAKPRKGFGKKIHILENYLAHVEIWENYPSVSCLELAPGMAHVQGEVKLGLAIHLTHSLVCQKRHHERV